MCPREVEFRTLTLQHKNTSSFYTFKLFHTKWTINTKILSNNYNIFCMLRSLKTIKGIFLPYKNKKKKIEEGL